VFSIFTPGKYPPQPTFYRLIGLLDTIGKFKVLLARILHEVASACCCGAISSVFDPYSTSQQLAPHERIARNFGEKRLTAPVSWTWSKPSILWIKMIYYPYSLQVWWGRLNRKKAALHVTHKSASIVPPEA
jgi:hypothetical protein